LFIYTLNSYEVQSNVSCVNGRADIIVISKNQVFPSYVLELKFESDIYNEDKSQMKPNN